MVKWNKNFCSILKMYVPYTIFVKKKKERKKNPELAKSVKSPTPWPNQLFWISLQVKLDKEEILFSIWILPADYET